VQAASGNTVFPLMSCREKRESKDTAKAALHEHLRTCLHIRLAPNPLVPFEKKGGLPAECPNADGNLVQDMPSGSMGQPLLHLSGERRSADTKVKVKDLVLMFGDRDEELNQPGREFLWMAKVRSITSTSFRVSWLRHDQKGSWHFTSGTLSLVLTLS